MTLPGIEMPADEGGRLADHDTAAKMSLRTYPTATMGADDTSSRAQPSQRKTLTEKAYDYVRSAILRGEMPVGTVIAEATLAAELGISKTPLRQALQLLRTEGLLEVGRRKQLVVRAFSPEHRNEILRIREALEELAVETAVNALTVDEIDLLRLALFRQKRAADAGNEELFLELDEQFHIMIAHGAKLHIVATVLEQIRGFARLMRLGRVQPPEHLHEVLEEHGRLVDAIESRDQALALRVLHDHLHHWDYLVEPHTSANSAGSS